MNDADEPLILDHCNDGQELIATQEEEHCSLLSEHGESAAKNLNPGASPNETLKVPDTASCEGVLEVPESVTCEDSRDVPKSASREDIRDIPESQTREVILHIPESAFRGDLLDVPESASRETILGVPESRHHKDILELPENASQDCDPPCLNILSPLSNVRDGSEVESDDASSGSSLFRTQRALTPTRTTRNRSLARSPQRPSSKAQYKDSSDSSPEPLTRFNLKKIFERRSKRRNYRLRKGETGGICRKTVKHAPQPSVSIPLARQQRRWKDEAFQFPFLAKKDLTLRMIFTYEQASLWGLLHQMKKRKYDRHLQASLKNLDVTKDVGKDSEDGHMEGRGYGYLDDEGPISPITELNEDDGGEDTEIPEEYDAKIVDNNCFILNWNPPPKEKHCKKRKKNTEQQEELDQEEDASSGHVSHHALGEAAAEKHVDQKEAATDLCSEPEELC